MQLLWKPVALFLTLAFAISAFPQTKARIIEAIDDRETVELQGNVRPTLHAAIDQGRMDGAKRLQISMAFKRSAEQEAALQKLLQEQQDPASPNYHRWITPEEFADRFGLSSSDLAAVTNWLQSQGFTVERVARARTQVWFSGPVSKIETVFRTEMHHFKWNGETHFANSTELAVPAAMADVVLGFRNLDDFRPRARVRTHRVPADAVHAHLTSSLSGAHFVIPGDFATIYHIPTGFDGTGVNLVVVGQTALVTNSSGAFTDIDAFRAAAGLPARTATNFKTTQVPNSGTATVTSGDIGEASLDVEWSEGVANNVNQNYVFVGNSPNFNVFDSLLHAIDNNLAPVISISYGNCERTLGVSNVQIFQGWTQQANAQGQTISAASGDFGPADCDTSPALPAQGGMAVDVPAALPYVTGVGGTTFSGDAAATVSNSCAAATSFWSASCSLTGGASALSYIPEVSWNDTTLANNLDASGGGASAFFSKPNWQIGTGVPSDGARDVPDVSFSGSPNHDAYLLCATDSAASPPTLPCTNGFRDSSNNFNAAGGTSFGAPAFAGVVAIINQKAGSSGQGNVNPTLYALAASTPSAFHDITSGNNIVPCGQSTTNCPTTAPFQYGFSAGTGYDQVTGLGSIDIGNLVNAWSSANPTAADFNMVGTTSGTTIATPGGQGSSTITVDARNGFSGTVTLACTAPATALITCSLSPSSITLGSGTNSGTATLTIKTTAKASLEPQGVPLWFTASGGLVAGVFMLGISSRRRRLGVAMTLVVLALLIAAVGCGGSGSHSTSPGTPAGSYVVTVTGTSSSTSHTTNVSVIVQ